MNEDTARLLGAFARLLERFYVVTRPPSGNGSDVQETIGFAAGVFAKNFRQLSKKSLGEAHTPSTHTPAHVAAVTLAALADALERAPQWDSRDATVPPGWREDHALANAARAHLKRTPNVAP